MSDVAENDHPSTVAISRLASPRYPRNPPFDPAVRYPEVSDLVGYNDEHNEIYGAIRAILISLSLDKKNIGTVSWNPFRELAPEGGMIVIKPNLVSQSRNDAVELESIVTHGSIIRPLVDYALKAVGDDGEVCVADAPQFDSSFDQIVKGNGLSETLKTLSERYGRSIPLIDLRTERVTVENGIVANRTQLPGDPRGYTVVDVGEHSKLNDVSGHAHRFRGSDYDRSITVFHHTDGKHQYLISNTILDADCVVSVPKLKTHKKAGVTLNLKNLVGINGAKNMIPHYRVGASSVGGDEMPDMGIGHRILSKSSDVAMRFLPKSRRPGIRLLQILRKVDASTVGSSGMIQRSGDWYGNDTIWRSVQDLYYILRFMGGKGEMKQPVGRNCISIIDGVVAGEGNGPLFPTARLEGLLMGGKCLVSVDLAAISAMGHDYRIFPTYRCLGPPLIEGSIDSLSSRIEVRETNMRKTSFEDLRSEVNIPFQLPDGWVGS